MSFFGGKSRTADDAAVQGTNAVTVEALKKKYPRAREYALKGISFSIDRGEIVGLLGHNGAGKSTTLKCLTGMLPFTEGEISIFGRSVKTDATAVKASFGFVTDNHAVFSKMTGLEYIAFMADIYGVSKEDRESRLAELQECFGLGERIGTLISSYSHGMKQKICMMGSLIHNPPLWILDEPMVGLDPRTMRAVSDYMRAYAEKGGAVLFSTHNLDAVKRICDRAVVIRNGLIELDSPVAELDGDDLLERFFPKGEED